MPDKKISALTAASTPLAGTEVLPIVQSSTTKKVAVSDLTAGRTVESSVLNVAGAETAGNISALSGYAKTDTSERRTLSIRSTEALASNPLELYFALKGSATASDQAGVIQTGHYGLDFNALLCINPNGAGVTIGDFTNPGSGNLRLGTGNLIVGTAGKGIDFSANTHAAGMTSELLNWYEEGTWTPALQSWTISGTAPTVTGRYTRIGREVYLYAQIAPAGGTVSYAAVAGTSYINGLPFTPGFNSGGIWTDASNAANTLDTNLVNTAGNAYAPTIAATADVIIFACHFSV